MVKDNNIDSEQLMDNNEQLQHNDKKSSQDLREKSRFRIFLRFLALLFGVGFTLGAILIYIYRFDIDGFSFILLYENKEQRIPIMPFLGILLLVFGMYFIARFIKFNTSKVRENLFYIPHLQNEQANTNKPVKLSSFSTSRLFCALFLIILIVINLLQYGFTISGENHLGCWMFLGGPSLFIPTSTFAVFFATGLLIYVLLSTSLMRFSESNNYYYIEEYRIGVPWMTEIPKEEIVGIRLSNRHTGPKFAWIFVILFSTILLFQDGFHFLLNPFAYGYGIIAGIHYVMSASLQLLVLLILLFKHQTFLEIITKEKRYELWFSPPASTPDLIGKIEELFGMPLLIDGLKNKGINSYRDDLGNENNIITENQKRYGWDPTHIISGIIILVISLISNIYRVIYAGEVLRFFFYCYSIYLITRGIKNDVYRNNMRIVVHDKEKNILFWRKKWGAYNEIYRINETHEDDFEIVPRIKKLNFFDVLFAIVIPIIIGIDFLSVGLLMVGESRSILIISHILFNIGVLFIIVINTLNPQRTLWIKKDSLKFEYTLPQSPKNIKETWISAFTFQKEAFILRLVVISLCVLIGALYVSIYLDVLGLIIGLGLMILLSIGYIFYSHLKK